MRPDYDQSQVNRRLRSLGETTSAEPNDTAERQAEADHFDDDSRPASSGTTPGRFTPLPRPVLRLDLSLTHVIAIVIAAVFALVIGWLGILPWYFTIAMILLLATTLIEGWRRLTLLGALAVIVIVAVNLVTAWDNDETVIAAAVVPTSPPTTLEPIPGSLGVFMDQLTTSWNGVSGEPQITRGLTRNNEIGEYDTFIFRFGRWGRVAGAYDPDTEAIYALLAAGQMSEPATGQLYVHLCFVIAPYSQECLDSYHEEGLGGGALEDFTDTQRIAEWRSEENEWNLQIDRNVLVIRVYGPDAS